MSSEDPLFDEFINFDGHPAGIGQLSDTVQSNARLEMNEKGRVGRGDEINLRSPERRASMYLSAQPHTCNRARTLTTERQAIFTAIKIGEMISSRPV